MITEKICLEFLEFREDVTQICYLMCKKLKEHICHEKHPVVIRTQPPARISAKSGMEPSLLVNLSRTKSLT